MSDAWKRALDLNYERFTARLSDYLVDHAGEYALLHDGDLLGFYPSPGQAEQEGKARFGDMPFSIQPVIEMPVDMGYFSYAAS